MKFLGSEPLISDSGASYTPGILERRNGVSTFLNSGLKDVAKQTDAAGSVTATRKYDAYGMVIGSTGTWKGPFGYSGSAGYQEDETGLQLLGHRYYDSSSGRFITRDPIKAGRNWYGYCNNNPVNAVDANGLDHFVIVKGGTSNWYDQGEQEIILQQLLRWLDANGHTYEILDDADRQEAINALKHADSFVYLGHGTDGGGTIAPSTDDDRAWVMDERFMNEVMAARNGEGFDRIWLFCCQGDQQAKFMSTYCNFTVSWSGGFNKWKSAIFLQRLGKEMRKSGKRKKVKFDKPWQPKQTIKSPRPAKQK